MALEEDSKKLNSEIMFYLEKGGQDNLNIAYKLCEENNIDSNQFKEYFQMSPSEDLESKIEPNSNNLSTISLVSKTQYHKHFPYTKTELTKLNLLDLKSIIAGCYSTYGSREILEVFNPREYLAKMKEINFLKSDDTNYLKELNKELSGAQEYTKISIEKGFEDVIKLLDQRAYGIHNWNFKYPSTMIADTFSTNSKDQQKRIEQIPVEEQRYFLRSLYKYKNITPALMSTPSILGTPNKFYDYRMNSENKHDHVDMLYEILKHKWNNKDEKPESPKNQSYQDNSSTK